MLEPAASFSELTDRFRWQVPATCNIAELACGRFAVREPERIALLHRRADGETERWSYGALQAASGRFANALAAKGVTRGERVALLLPQAPETLIAHLAIYRMGAIAVPLASLFGAEALRYRLEHSGAAAIVTDAAGLAKLEALGDALPELRLRIVTGEVAGALPEGTSGFDALLAAAREDFETLATGPDDPALMIYTSGTTGQPKGALHGHRVLPGHMPGIQMSQDFMPQPGDILWTPADWAWAGGLLNALFPALSLGVPVVSHRFEKFDPERAFALMRDHGVRNAFIPPTALKMMRAVSRPRERFELALRSLGSAGEALGREAYDWTRDELGITVNEFYGQTECNAVIGSCAAIGVSRAGAIGKAVPGHEVAVLGEDGAVLSAGVQGQIAVRRPDPVMFLGYWNDPAATAAKFIGDWMTTGDQGVIDEDGYVHFIGRDDDIITSAGYRIGPSEIEDCLLAHPAVRLAAAVGKPDPLRTEIVKAFIVPADGVVPDEALAEEIRGFVRTRLSAHEYPREVAFVDALPMTTTGKVIRRLLREEG
ncbi:acyl-CoA synthetase [Stappia sp. MMSF_3263]|uniref:acyl-CoA synthetase n=1 Tax=Stappia sp. MMSF_3263 TaxID=3046693 RepID=UPI00273E23EE|nr:acyl-CoA synthetase [Stappia sp. MMSF_3263]